MCKVLIPIFAAASMLGVAAPVSAQWAPPNYRYAPYDYAHGFNGFNFARSMHQRVERLRSDIRAMEGRRILSVQEARSLDRQADNLQRRIYGASRNGIQPGEARRLENNIQRLEYRISREANDWNNRPRGRRY